MFIFLDLDMFTMEFLYAFIKSPCINMVLSLKHSLHVFNIGNPLFMLFWTPMATKCIYHLYKGTHYSIVQTLKPRMCFSLQVKNKWYHINILILNNDIQRYYQEFENMVHEIIITITKIFLEWLWKLIVITWDIQIIKRS